MSLRSLLQPKQGPRCPECPLFKPGIPVLDKMPDLTFCGLSLVGEMPGRAEVKALQPFIGPSGRILDTIWGLLGVPPGILHVTNCVHCGLSGGAKPGERKMKAAMECCEPLMLENLSRMGSKVVCAVGAVAWKSLSGMTGIDKFRGTVIDSDDTGQPWILTSTIHPAGLLRTDERKILFDLLFADLQKAHQLALGAEKPWKPDVRDASEVDKLISFIKKVKDLTADLAVDVETTDDVRGRIDPYHAKLLTIGIAAEIGAWDSESWGHPVAWSIPWRPRYPEYYTDEQWSEILGLLVEIFDNPEQHLIFHNKPFDVPVLRRHLGIKVDAIKEDTLLMHHAGYPKLPHTLQQAASHFIAVEPWKDNFKASDDTFWNRQQVLVGEWDRADDTELEGLEKRVWDTERENLAELLWYNAADAAVTAALYHLLSWDLKQMGLLHVYERDRRLLDYTLDWTEDGIGIDLEQRDKLEVQYRRDLDFMEERLRHLSKLPTSSELAPEIKRLEDEVNKLQDSKRQYGRVVTLVNRGVDKLKDRWDFIDKKNDLLSSPGLSGESEGLLSRTVAELTAGCISREDRGKAEKSLARAYRDQEDIEMARDLCDEKSQQEALDWLTAKTKNTVESIKVVYDHLKEVRKLPTLENFKPGSSQHILDILIRRGMTPTKVTKKGNISVSRDSLWPLRDDEFIGLLFDWRKKQKLYSTYIVNLENKLGEDNRLHPTWKLHSTPSGRFGTTPAVQNWPKSMRSLMIAPEGHKIVGADYAALELRITALLSGEIDWINIFLRDGDLHDILAHQYFPEYGAVKKEWDNVKGDEVMKDLKVPRRSELRGRGKNVTFGDIYLAGAETLYDQVREKRPDVQTPEQHDQLRREVASMQQVLRAATPDRVEWANIQRRIAQETCCLQTIRWTDSVTGENQGGRERRWPMRNPSPNECANHPIQGTAADIMNAATIRLTNRLKEMDLYRNGIWVILQIHDALYLEVADEMYEGRPLPEVAAELLEECMYCELEYTSPVTGNTNRMKFPAEAKIGNSVKEV